LERFRLTVESRSRTSQRLNEFLEVFSDAKLDVLRGVALDRLAVPDRAELERMIIETQARIDDNVEHLKRRLALPNSRVKRLPQVLDEWRTGRYYVHSRGWQSVLLDVVRK
jgi:hypothetical protein